MKENIKIGLLGIIALTLIADTFFMTETVAVENATAQSNVAAAPSISPTNTMPTPPPAPVQLSETRAKTTIDFAEIKHDFGTVKQDTKNTKIFRFTNTGDEPLIIENAKGSCGCTVPKFPKEPILPGATGEIEVVYSPGKQEGAQSKNVTITANTDPIVTSISISANVEKL